MAIFKTLEDSRSRTDCRLGLLDLLLIHYLRGFLLDFLLFLARARTASARWTVRWIMPVRLMTMAESTPDGITSLLSMTSVGPVTGLELVRYC